MSRKRYVYRPDVLTGELHVVEVDLDWKDDSIQTTGDLDKFRYDNLRQADGTVTDTPQKLREWQRRTGTEHVTELQQEAARVRHERETERQKRLVPSVVEAYRKLEATKWRRK